MAARFTILKPAVWVTDDEGREFPALPLVRLRVPFYAAVGLHERLSIQQLDDLISDLQHERARRAEKESAS